MDLLQHFRTGVRANRLANRRLHAAMAGLSRADFDAPRTGFFPSLAATLHHILAVDTYYVAALHREADMVAQHDACAPAEGLADVAERQRAVDERLIAYVDRLDAAGLDAAVVLDRGDTRQTERPGHVLAHLLMHQTHHRGQAHAMLWATRVAPPQLDEFLLPSDAPNRAADLRALGWSERDLVGTRPG